MLEVGEEYGAEELKDLDVLEVGVGQGGGVKVGQAEPPVHLGSRLAQTLLE